MKGLWGFWDIGKKGIFYRKWDRGDVIKDPNFLFIIPVGTTFEVLEIEETETLIKRVKIFDRRMKIRFSSNVIKEIEGREIWVYEDYPQGIGRCIEPWERKDVEMDSITVFRKTNF